ncbi:hypothetical protein FG167_09390 [Lacinutrix sp. WUR7]|uniref:hypothetical protein n=1 Tax=Lacinutrix sp. WUR7 TaxID=2653681 RepID=UPI00193D312B|nr:hypothetical protein [Lacinutrix sp. WUR7]QRM89443.1 hypothetical protein FG167_09390 [Lacinutrix sp. WUR7]
MKTRYVVLVLLSVIMFTNNSCDEDDRFPQDDPEQVEFTATNYIYEGDLRKYYLETENTRLSADIAIWQQIPDSDPGYNDAQASITQANIAIANNNEESQSIISPENAFLIPPRIPPVPPAPSPCLCLTEFNTFRNIIFQPGTNILSLNITSVANQNTLVNTNANSQIHTIENTNGLGKYQSFGFSEDGFTGEVMITVVTANGSYSILANLVNL